MNKETAIVFSATFVGLFASVFTFNCLVANNILPQRVEKLANIEVKPEVAAASTTRDEVPTPKLPDVPASHLQTVVDKALEGTTGSYAVAIKNLKTGESYYKDEHKSFESASLYKLWVMGTVYKQLKEGTFKEDETLSADVASLNRQFGIASESAERSVGGITLTVASALKQMITISHNYAALLLSSKVKLANVKAYLAEKQLNDSKTGSPPKTTAADTLAFFEKLYKGELDDKDTSEKMLTLLKGQKLNNKLPKYLPKDVVMAHKTGELGGVTHDAGIIYTNKGDYAIAILSESKYPKGAEDRIATISKDVYAYFTK